MRISPAIMSPFRCRYRRSGSAQQQARIAQQPARDQARAAGAPRGAARLTRPRRLCSHSGADVPYYGTVSVTGAEASARISGGRPVPMAATERQRSASIASRARAAALTFASRAGSLPVVLRKRHRQDRPARSGERRVRPNSRCPIPRRRRSASRRRRRESLVRAEGGEQDRPHHAQGRDRGISAADRRRPAPTA